MRGNAKQQRQSVRFRSHSFDRSVADLGFSPNATERLLEVQERERTRNRIIGHVFRAGGSTGLTSSVSSAPFRDFRSKKQHKMNRPLKTPRTNEMRVEKREAAERECAEAKRRAGRRRRSRSDAQASARERQPSELDSDGGRDGH